MTSNIKVFAVILIIPFLLSSCASILNSKFQKVTIKTSENSTVLVDGRVPERTEDGRYLIRRDAEAKQITVKKEGQKDINTSIIQYKKSPFYIMSVVPFGITIFPIMCDNMIKSRNYTNTVSLENRTKELPNKEKISSIIKLNEVNTIANDESNFSREKVAYRKFISGSESANKKSKKLINLGNHDFYRLLIKSLEEQDYMKYGESNVEKLYINATLNNYRYHSFISRAMANGGTISSYGSMLYVDMGIKWEVMDENKKVLFTHQTNVVSDQFAYLYKTKSASLDNAIKDGTHTSFIDLVNSAGFKKEMDKREADLTSHLAKNTAPKVDLDTASSVDIILAENKDGILYLSKKNIQERASFRGDGTIGIINKSAVIKMVEDIPLLHKYASENINSGKGFTASLIACYNDYKLTGKTKTLNQSYFNGFGLITKKEYKSGPSAEMLKIKKPISGEIKHVRTTTTHYSNAGATSSTTGDNFKFKFSYGNAEYKKGFLLKNLKLAIGDDEEAQKHIGKYRRNYIARIGLKVLAVSALTFTLMVADDKEPMGISSDATIFLAIPTLGIFSWGFKPQNYKAKNITNAINTYNSHL